MTSSPEITSFLAFHRRIGHRRAGRHLPISQSGRNSHKTHRGPQVCRLILPPREALHRGTENIVSALRQLVEQRLGLLQIERVKPFGKSAVDRRKKLASLLSLALSRERMASGSPHRIPGWHPSSQAPARLRNLPIPAGIRFRRGSRGLEFQLTGLPFSLGSTSLHTP